MDKDNKYLHCSFCGKSQIEVAKLIAAAPVSNSLICNGCVERCKEIVEETIDSDGRFLRICRLCGSIGKPEEMLTIEKRGDICQTCVPVLYENIVKWKRK